jgi:RNA polymerase-interacting CarD/CdnL/TRCF family regulator
MNLVVGHTVVYPQQGPCRIGAVVDKVVAGNAVSFLQLAVLDDSGDALLVPVNKVDDLGLRHLIAKSEIAKLMTRLGRTEAPPKALSSALNWKQRVIDNTKLLASGSAMDLAKIVRSLTSLNAQKPLSPRDRQVLDKAKKHLVCEIAEVMGESRSAAGARVELALQETRLG